MPVGSSAKTICGTAHQRPRARHPLLLPAGELVGAVVEPVAELDGVDDLVVPRTVDVPSGDVERQRDVLRRGQGRHEVERLEDEADRITPKSRQILLGQGREVDLADEDLPLGGRVEPCEAMQQR